jgi:uncharacterized membrane protein
MKPETWSNIAYIILGVVWIGNGLYLLGIYAVLLGLASAYSHHTRVWMPDWAMMYVMFGGLILHLTGNPVELALFAIPLTYYLRPYLLDNFALIGVLAIISFVLSANTWLVLTIFTIGFIIRQIGDKTHFQLLHSLWHLITAIGFYYVII